MLFLEEVGEALPFQLHFLQERLTVDELKLRQNVLTYWGFSLSLSWISHSAIYYSTQHSPLQSCSWHKWSHKSPLFEIIKGLSASVLLLAFGFKWSLQFLSYSQINETPNSAGKGNPTVSHLNRRPTCIFWLCLSVFPWLDKENSNAYRQIEVGA